MSTNTDLELARPSQEKRVEPAVVSMAFIGLVIVTFKIALGGWRARPVSRQL